MSRTPNEPMRSKDIADAIRGLRAGHESRSGSLNALRVHGAALLLYLGEEALLRQLTRESESPNAIDKAIERAQAKIAEEMDNL